MAVYSKRASEFLLVASQIAGGLDVVLGRDSHDTANAEQRFCVALEAGIRWCTLMSITNGTSEDSVISVDYCNLPIRCPFYRSTKHLIKKCKGIKSSKRGVVDATALTQEQPAVLPPAQNHTLQLGANNTKDVEHSNMIRVPPQRTWALHWLSIDAKRQNAVRRVKSKWSTRLCGRQYSSKIRSASFNILEQNA